MHPSSQAARYCPDVANLLLRRLPDPVLGQILEFVDRVNLVQGQIVSGSGHPCEHVYFVNRGLIFLMRTMQDGRTAAVGAIGIEGTSELSNLFMRGSASIDATVQVPGEAFRIRRSTLRAAMDRFEALHILLQRHTAWAVGQLADTAACNRLHGLNERCCRWLLSMHDNALSDTFPVTHESLALILGAQRSSVSLTTSGLRSAGFIKWRAGQVRILDRFGLEQAACECYRAACSHFTMALGAQPATIERRNGFDPAPISLFGEM